MQPRLPAEVHDIKPLLKAIRRLKTEEDENADVIVKTVITAIACALLVVTILLHIV